MHRLLSRKIKLPLRFQLPDIPVDDSIPKMRDHDRLGQARTSGFAARTSQQKLLARTFKAGNHLLQVDAIDEMLCPSMRISCRHESDRRSDERFSKLCIQIPALPPEVLSAARDKGQFTGSLC